MPQYDFWRQPYSKDQLAAAANNIVPIIDPTSKNWKLWNIASMRWVDTGIPAAGKNPYIGSDHYWYVWDTTQNKYVNTGYSVAQDAVQSVNGVFADAHGNVSITWANMDGANLVSHGGTGATTASKAVYNLINGTSSTLTAISLNGADLLPVDDVSATTGKKITVQNLMAYLQNNMTLSKFQVGSYVGTGVCGSANPNSITFAFEPEYVILLGEKHNNVIDTIGNNNYDNNFVAFKALQTAFTDDQGFGATRYRSGKRSGNTIFWYVSDSTSQGMFYQYNGSGYTYYWIAFA